VKTINFPSGEMAGYLNHVGSVPAEETNQREQKIKKARKNFILFDVYLNNKGIKLLI
jgi:response regulator of citrate/malate metabolism